MIQQFIIHSTRHKKASRALCRLTKAGEAFLNVSEYVFCCLGVVKQEKTLTCGHHTIDFI